MTQKKMENLIKKIFKQIQKTREAGQKEYARKQSNAFANFERVADYIGSSKEKVLMTYVYKHIDGIMAYINGHTSQREDVRGRIKDIMVYMTLLWAMVEESEDIFLDRLKKETLMLDKMGFTQSKTVSNPKAEEVSYPEYQNTGDEII